MWVLLSALTRSLEVCVTRWRRRRSSSCCIVGTSSLFDRISSSSAAGFLAADLVVEKPSWPAAAIEYGCRRWRLWCSLRVLPMRLASISGVE